MALWLKRNESWLRAASLLHFAPEPCLAAWLRDHAKQHLSADILPGRADRVLNIEALDLPDGSFDGVVCSHVLEHVEDSRALAEIHRVLQPGGIALIMVPVIEGWLQTYEPASVQTPQERKRHFGQSDHLRFYGADVRQRIRNAGFELDEFTAEGADVLTHGLQRGEKVFVARKPDRPSP